MITKFNSKTLLASFIIKYINSPMQTLPKNIFDKISYKFTIDESFSFLNDINYSIILSYITSYERTMFIRFFQTYLYKVYGMKHNFFKRGVVNWIHLQNFISTNKQYNNFFLTCFYYYF